MFSFFQLVRLRTLLPLSLAAVSLAANAEPLPTQPPGESGVVVAADGAELYYRAAGPRDAALALLFVPGWGMDADIWEAQLARFGARYRVVAIDPRSQGRSSKTTQGNTPDGKAADLREVIQALRLQRVVLVAWSLAVQDVAAYVERYGSADLAGIVLVDAPIAPGPRGVREQPALVEQLLERLHVYATHPEPYLRGMMRAIFARPLPPDRIERLVRVAMATPVPTGVSTLALGFYGKDRRAAFATVAVPVLVIASPTAGHLDAQRELAGQLRHGRFVAIEGAGHGVFVDQPAKFDAALAEFLETCCDAAAAPPARAAGGAP